MLYKEWLSFWLENYAQPSVKARTYVRYGEIIKLHISPNLGDLEISEIEPATIQRFTAELLKGGNLKTGGGLSANSVNSVITIIQSTLKMAYSTGLSPKYVADKIKRPRTKEKRVECFSVCDQKKMESYIIKSGKAKFFGILLTLYTGLRIGELLALEWADVDMRKCELNVNKTCYYGKNNNGKFGRITDVPKTPSSVRTIPIPKQLMLYLSDVKKKSRSTHIVSNGELPISVRSYQRSFLSLLRKLEIKQMGFHSLRHTFATRALECGMDVKTLSEILGHKSPTVTLNRYAHSLPEHKREMMNRLGRLL